MAHKRGKGEESTEYHRMPTDTVNMINNDISYCLCIYPSTPVDFAN
jgi:hypothetical protein